MDAATYDRWYESPRGQWIGEREAALVRDCLAPGRGESLLDVGCGTGFFTRALADSVGGRATGVDLNADWIEYARRRGPAGLTFEVGDARALPYADASFGLVVSVAALCFVDDEARAAREIVRVARRRFAVGLLNRRSLLWREKGRNGGSGGYRGARWHTVDAARELFRGLAVRRLRVATAIQLPGGGWFARAIERVTPPSLPYGGFLVVAGDIDRPAGSPGAKRIH